MKKFLGLVPLLWLLASCGSENGPFRSATPSPVKNSSNHSDTSSEVPSPEIRTTISPDFAPYFVLTYSQAGNTDLAVVREFIRHIDANSKVDQDLLREREFTDYPYTVDSYVIWLKDSRARQELEELSYRFPNVKILSVPFQSFRVRSYFHIKYAKAWFKKNNEKVFWIGDSPRIDLRNDLQNVNIEDTASYLPYFRSCRFFTPQCLKVLLSQGYFSVKTLIDDDYVDPQHYLLSELTTTLSTKNQKKPIVKWNLNSRIISEISLENQVWIKGVLTDTEPALELQKISGSDFRPIVFVGQQGEQFFSLPVNAAGADMPDEAADSEDGLMTFLENLQGVLNEKLQ